MMKSCKLIPNKFDRTNNTWCKFISLLNKIFVKKMKDNQLNVLEDFLSINS